MRIEDTKGKSELAWIIFINRSGDSRHRTCNKHRIEKEPSMSGVQKEPLMNPVQVEQKNYEMPPREGISVAHFLTVNDVERSARYYEKVFGAAF